MKLKKAMVLMFLFATGVAAFAQTGSGNRLRIAVPPMQAETSNPTLLSLAGAVRESMLLNLGIMGYFDVVPMAVLPQDAEALRTVAQNERIDRIVLGRILPAEAGSFEILVSLYIAAQNMTVDRSETARNVFDVFGAIDRLTLSLLQELSGTHLSYGRLELVPAGLPGDWDLFINGYPAGHDVTEVARLVSGTHRIRIAQNRMFGQTTLLEREVAIEEESATSVVFEIPAILPSENERLTALLLEAQQGVRTGAYAERGLAARMEARRAMDAAYQCPDIDAARALDEEIEAERRVRGLEDTLNVMRRIIDPSFLGDLSAAYREYAGNNLWPALRERLADDVYAYAYQFYCRAVREMAAGNLSGAESLLSAVLANAQGLPPQFLGRVNFAVSERPRFEALLASGETDTAGLFHLVKESFGYSVVLRDPAALVLPAAQRSLLIETDPPGLEIAVNDTYYGSSPVLIREDLEPEMRIVILSEGQELRSENATLGEWLNHRFYAFPMDLVSGGNNLVDAGWQTDEYLAIQEQIRNRRRWYFPISVGMGALTDGAAVMASLNVGAVRYFVGDWYFGLALTPQLNLTELTDGTPNDGFLDLVVPIGMLTAMYRPLFRTIGHYFGLLPPLPINGMIVIGASYSLLLNRWMIGTIIGGGIESTTDAVSGETSPSFTPMIGLTLGFVL